MSHRTAHVALFDDLAHWEVGHLLAELRTGRLTAQRFDVVTVAESLEPITAGSGRRLDRAPEGISGSRCGYT
jgi:hypothetical protein